jgi:hypothetical protein
MVDLGTVFGTIGMVTGLASLVVSIKNYLRISALKSLDMRIKLQESLNDLELTRKGIETFLDAVDQSRQRVMAAKGLLNSGAWEIWKKDIEGDKQALQRLLVRAPQNVGGYEKLSAVDLETQLVAVHRYTGELKDLRAKYQRLLDEDDRWREMRQAQMTR